VRRVLHGGLTLGALLSLPACFGAPPAAAAPSEPASPVLDLSACDALVVRAHDCADALATAPSTRVEGQEGVDLSANPFTVRQACARFADRNERVAACLVEEDCERFARCVQTLRDDTWSPAASTDVCGAVQRRTWLECPAGDWHELSRLEPADQARARLDLARAGVDCPTTPALARSLATCLPLPCSAYSGCMLDVINHR